MKKLFLVLALLIIGFGSQGAFATSVPNTYPACYKGYGVGDPLYNGTNGDKFDTDGWCIDGFGVLTPKTGITTSTTQPNSQGGYAVPVVIYNAGPTNANGTASPVSTYDALIPQQTGSHIVDYAGYTVSATTDTLVGSGGHYVLPPAYPGEEFTIASATKSVITVDTLNPGFATTEGLTYPTADTIQWSPGGTAMTAGQNLKSPGFAGDTITLYCPTQGIWQIQSMLGSQQTVVTQDSNWVVISTT